MNLYTHTMATNLAVTSVYTKANNVLEPKHSGAFASVTKSIKMEWKSQSVNLS